MDHKQKHLVETSRNSGKVLSDIVDAVLDFSTVESGNLELEEAGFSVASAVSMVTDILAVPAREKGIGFEVSLDPALPDKILGDATRLRQVLFNLVGNAIKFTNKGQVKVTVSSEDGQTDQGLVSIRFDIEDTGSGISTHDQGLLFKEFTQVEQDRQGEMLRGTGLGLAISRKLIELMGGEIFVGSVPEQGSHFWFIVPMKPIPERKLQTRPPGHDSANPEVHPATRGPGVSDKNILVVEDSQTNQLVIKFMLENAGLNCGIVDSGEQALEALANEEFQLILMDIGLPGIDGIETARRIRALGTPTASIPIIALTAYAFMEDKQRCRDDRLRSQAHRA